MAEYVPNDATQRGITELLRLLLEPDKSIPWEAQEQSIKTAMDALPISVGNDRKRLIQELTYYSVDPDQKSVMGVPKAGIFHYFNFTRAEQADALLPWVHSLDEHLRDQVLESLGAPGAPLRELYSAYVRSHERPDDWAMERWFLTAVSDPLLVSTLVRCVRARLERASLSVEQRDWWRDTFTELAARADCHSPEWKKEEISGQTEAVLTILAKKSAIPDGADPPDAVHPPKNGSPSPPLPNRSGSHPNSAQDSIETNSPLWIILLVGTIVALGVLFWRRIWNRR